MHRCMHARNYRMYSKQDSKDSPLAEYDPLDLKHFVIKTETSDEPSSGFMLVLTPAQKPRPPPPLPLLVSWVNYSFGIPNEMRWTYTTNRLHV